MIFTAFFDALGQLSDRRFRKVLLIGLAVSAALLIATTSGGVSFVGWLVSDGVWVPFYGTVFWLSDFITWGSFIVFFVLSIFLMVPIAGGIISIFLDEVAQAVEDKHYAHLPAAKGTPFGDALIDTINFLGVLIGANLLALLLYVMFAPVALFIFWGLNGFLLGREYFTLVAIRRVGRVEAKRLRSKHSGTIWMAGILMAMPLSVPLINLFVPIIGAATFTHIYHRLTAVAEPGQTS